MKNQDVQAINNLTNLGATLGIHNTGQLADIGTFLGATDELSLPVGCWGGQCCCSCQFHVPDLSHPCTDGKMITAQRGWICFLPELEDAGISGWPEHGACECYQRRNNYGSLD